MRTEQKAAVITGASQGIGAALFEAYRGRVWRVVAIARSIKPSSDTDIVALPGEIADRRTAERAIGEGVREKHGIRQAGFWTTLIGKSIQEIIYMLAWDSMAEREKRWGAFLADPEWVAVVAKTEKDGQLIEDINSQLLVPAAFSAVK